MKILSLFNGCGMLRPALEKAGIKVTSLHYCEIDKTANAVMHHNYPQDTLISTDVTTFHPKEGDYDLIVGGFPCQQFSVANKDRKGLEGGSGVLFYEAKRILDTVKPKFFILENVASMKKDIQQYINEQLGVKAIMLDASWFSAQRRRRLFWSNLPIELPKEKSKTILKDVLVGGTATYNNFNDKVSEDKSATLGTGSGTITGKQAQMVLNDQSNLIPEKYYLSKEQLEKVRWLKRDKKIPMKPGQTYKPFGGMKVPNDETKKVSCLLTNQGINRITPVVDQTRLGYIEKDFNPNLENYSPSQGTRILNTETKTTCLPSMPQGLDYILDKSQQVAQTQQEGKIRRLMPLECERLMGLKDNYTLYGDFDGVTKELKDTHRYKLCGNGFHVDVIAYILWFINK